MSNESEEKERQRVLDLIKEDLRKEIPALLADVHEESLRYGSKADTRAITRTLARFASLHGKLFLESEKQSAKMLKWTRNVFWLSIGLGLVAIVQAMFAYFQLHAARAEREQARQYEHHEAQPALQTPINRPTKSKP